MKCVSLEWLVCKLKLICLVGDASLKFERKKIIGGKWHHSCTHKFLNM